MRYDEKSMSVHVHQSDIKDWLNCGHQTFLKKQIEGQRFETDAATVGTVLHKVIETEMDEGFFFTEQEALQFAMGYFLELLVDYQKKGSVYSRSSFDTDEKAIKVIERVVKIWYRSDERADFGQMTEFLTEWDFDVPFDIRVGGYDVYLEGQSDLVVPNRKIVDWKTASQSYKPWEKRRWDVQSTAYTYAGAYEGLLVPDKRGEYEFDFVVFDTKGGTIGPPTVIPVKRSPRNWDWLRVQVTNMLMVQQALPEGPWPMSDQHVLCSPKWCPVWADCKGAVVSGETWT